MTLTPSAVPLRFVLFDWGDTLMAERGGPEDVSMALWPEVRAIEGAAEALAVLGSRYTLAIATNASVSRRDDIRRALTRTRLADGIANIFFMLSWDGGRTSRSFGTRCWPVWAPAAPRW